MRYIDRLFTYLLTSLEYPESLQLQLPSPVSLSLGKRMMSPADGIQ